MPQGVVKHGFGHWRDVLMDGELGLLPVLRQELPFTPSALTASGEADKVPAGRFIDVKCSFRCSSRSEQVPCRAVYRAYVLVVVVSAARHLAACCLLYWSANCKCMRSVSRLAE